MAMSNKPLPVVNRDTWCRHRTPFGTDHPVCKAGIDFHPFLIPSDRMEHMPCLGTPTQAEALATCPQYSGYSDEELAAREAEDAARWERIKTIRAAIIASGKTGGEIECPACKTGKVRFSVARSNGHVHAGCSTEGCARWME